MTYTSMSPLSRINSSRKERPKRSRQRGCVGFPTTIFVTLRLRASRAVSCAASSARSVTGSPPPAGSTGLYHVAILYPTRAALAAALRRLIEAGIALDGASDHGVSEALYLSDPDRNGVELYWDRPQEKWPRTPEGELAMFTRRLDLEDLLNEKV